jgi:hypothetical protein
MPPVIHVEARSETEFQVTIEEGGGSSSHQVTVRPETLDRVGGGAPADELVQRSFEFLLEREPKEAILGRFDLEVISRYFPEYESEIRTRLS